MPIIGDVQGVFVDSQCRSGGLALLWKEEVGVTLSSCACNHIDVSIKWLVREEKWRSTACRVLLRLKRN